MVSLVILILAISKRSLQCLVCCKAYDEAQLDYFLSGKYLMARPNQLELKTLDTNLFSILRCEVLFMLPLDFC